MRLYPEAYPVWERRLYTWDQFLRNIVYCTNIQGSALYDATLGDQDLIDELYEDAKAEQSAKIKKHTEPGMEPRPSRRGYSRTVEALYDLQDNIIALRAEMGRWPRTTTERAMSKRPWFPAEVVEEKMRKRGREIRNDRIAEAQARWRNRNAGIGTQLDRRTDPSQRAGVHQPTPGRSPG